jgi:Fic family protein
METKNKLSDILKADHLTQAQLANKLGVSSVTLSKWLNRGVKPRLNYLIKIDALYTETFGINTVENSVLESKRQELINIEKTNPKVLEKILSRRDIYDNMVLELTYHTNSIEGSTFNEPQVKAVLFDHVTIPNKTLIEHQEAKNHQAALGNLFKHLAGSDGKKDFTISEKLIKKLHAILMNGIWHNAGEYRTHAVRITGSKTVTTNYLSIENKMSEYVDLVNRDVKLSEVFEHMAKCHALFEQIHPFSDGNGRVGRLLLHITSLKYNFPPILIRKEKKLAYYKYLETAQTEGDLTLLENFVCDSLKESFKLLS